jgi:hypothetical protein
MTETALKRKVIDAASKIDRVHWLKIHGNAYQRTGEPDLIFCVDGQFAAVELKVGNNKPTELQLHRLAQWRRAGGFTCVCYSLKQFLEFIESIGSGSKKK